VLTPSSDGVSQVYTITQTPPTVATTTVTTVITNPVANKTTMQIGSGPVQSIAGVPRNLAMNSQDPPPAQYATVVYVDGTVTGLRGPAEGVPAIQGNAMITITAKSDVDITGDLRYTTEPVTANAADTLLYTTPPPAGTLAADMNTLGIYTNAGNIVLSSPYADQNLWVDGSLAAIGQSKGDNPPGNCTSSTCGFTVNGHINTFTNVGGQIQTNIFGASMDTENTYYDRRFTAWNTPATQNAPANNFFPPSFPATTVLLGGTPAAPNVAPTQTRTSWAWYTPS
jgi:hypothetical protein